MLSIFMVLQNGILMSVYILQTFIYLNSQNLLFKLKCTDNYHDNTDEIQVYYKWPVRKTWPELLYRQST